MRGSIFWGAALAAMASVGAVGGLGLHQGRRAAYGWTNRHAQRVARKKRNQARHRAAVRGRK